MPERPGGPECDLQLIDKILNLTGSQRNVSIWVKKKYFFLLLQEYKCLLIKNTRTE